MKYIYVLYICMALPRTVEILRPAIQIVFSFVRFFLEKVAKHFLGYFFYSGFKETRGQIIECRVCFHQGLRVVYKHPSHPSLLRCLAAKK